MTVENNLVIVPVVLGGDVGGNVASLNFHLNYDPNILEPVQAAPGNVAAQADKQVAFNVPSPGESVIVMFGLNQTTCSGGEVARIIMKRNGEVGQSQWALGLSNQTLSDVQGAVIDSRVIPFTPKPGEDEDDGEQKPEDDGKPKPEQPKDSLTDAPNRPSAGLVPTEKDALAQPGVVAQSAVPAENPKAFDANARKVLDDALKKASESRQGIVTPTVNGSEAEEAAGAAESGRPTDDDRQDVMKVAQVEESQNGSKTLNDKTIEHGIAESSGSRDSANVETQAKASSGKWLAAVAGASVAFLVGAIAFALLTRR